MAKTALSSKFSGEKGKFSRNSQFFFIFFPYQYLTCALSGMRVLQEIPDFRKFSANIFPKFRVFKNNLHHPRTFYPIFRVS